MSLSKADLKAMNTELDDLSKRLVQLEGTRRKAIDLVVGSMIKEEYTQAALDMGRKKKACEKTNSCTVSGGRRKTRRGRKSMKSRKSRRSRRSSRR
jgi:hypothetical protein